MKTVVITGSTRGIGYGLAQAFLERECAVVVNGRSADRVEAAVESLARYPFEDRVHGVAADVTAAAQVQALWDNALGRFGRIDYWINNAGLLSARGNLWELDPADVAAVINANLTAVANCCAVAIRGMRAQGFGHIYNMEGMGSEGRLMPGMSIYGTSKYGMAYLTKALVKEAADLPIVIASLNPGMVLTSGFLDGLPPERAEQSRRFLNKVADHVETVAPWLADSVLSNEKSGARFVWMTTPRMVGRMLNPRYRRRDLFADLDQHVT